MNNLTTLYRPVGDKEWQLILKSGNTKFPRRLEWQPIFYPVMNQEYAEQIAYEWNTSDEFSGFTGYVLAFDILNEYLQQFTIHNVGGDIHNELWIPADQLEEFNRHIVGKVRLVKSFYGKNVLLYKIQSVLFGLAIGDALGVPAEFKSRSFLIQHRITDFEGYQSHNQPPGTFSDDSSLAFCLAESLCLGYNLNDLAQRFIKWQSEAYWTASNTVFDIGITTYESIKRLKSGCPPQLAGEFDEDTNGNGSLMRIMPLLFYIQNFNIEKRYAIIKDVSSLTHAHIRSVIACFYYLEYALLLLQGYEKHVAYEATAQTVLRFLSSQSISSSEISVFDLLLKDNIASKKMKYYQLDMCYILYKHQSGVFLIATVMMKQCLRR